MGIDSAACNGYKVKTWRGTALSVKKDTHRFVPMTADYAAEIVSTWIYEGEHAIYNYANEAEHMLDSEAWGVGLFAVLDEHGALVGELSLDYFDENDTPLDYADYGNKALIDLHELWIGFGMRPDLIGQGRGGGFVRACVDFIETNIPYEGDFVHLGVALFNQRAIKAYQKAGFEIFEQAVGTINGKPYDVVRMRRALR